MRNPLKFLNQGDNPILAALCGMGPAEFNNLRSSRSAQEAQQRFAKMQEGVPKLFKELALTMHPDCNPGDPDATEKFAALSAVKDVLMDLKLQINQPRPQPVRRVIIIRQSPGFVMNTWTSTTTTGAW